MNPKNLITENDIKKQVKDWLDFNGWFNFHIRQGLGCYPGVPDRIACKNGIVLFIEIKKPDGRLSKVQKLFKEKIQSQGGYYIIAKCWEDLSYAIQQIGRSQRCQT